MTQTAARTATQRKTILVIEDEPDMASLIDLGLEVEGFSVHTELCGKTGLMYAAAHCPGLVMLDVRLPDIHGYQVAQELRKLYHPWVVPILMLTAMTQPVDQLRGFAHGADAYLTKPFDWEELLKTINLLLGETPS